MHLKYPFEALEMDGQVIAVPLGEHVEDFHGVLRLNEPSAMLLKLLKDDTTEAGLVDALAAEYDAPRSRLAQDVHGFLGQLRKKGLLIE